MMALAAVETFAVVGDSISAWVDRDGNPQPATWPNHITGLELVGGWAKGGAKLAEMCAKVTPAHADAVVILAGTNDLGSTWGTPMADRVQSVRFLAHKVGAPRVVVCAVPPLNGGPAWATEWNAVLQALCVRSDWVWVDPWGPYRTAAATWVTGASLDGIHPTPAVSIAIAGTIQMSLTP